ncbi:TonB family protein [Mucilaginibacter sp. 14171R-50]|uniref:M56 family metallopeptidase n=1 Tax=Mucilaginibacter sp. 14171R-50 TaxID=2703789 RepID=UPI00138B3BAB|nr:M56 family metallopeptidase [Mucilaginibacter sp. 14171R-50]QHS57701.1 TonB family protein [Mucilaginibacter sp. 14171R-50]
MSWLHYLVEANIYLGVFYLCYSLLLNRDTHYNLSRAYLIFSCIVSFVLPVTRLGILKPVEQIIIEEPVPSTVNQVKFTPAPIAVATHSFTLQDVVLYVYVTGTIIACLIFLFRLRKLYVLTRNNHSLYQDQYKLVKLNDQNTAFSFFNYLYVGSNIPQAETIIAHELVHIRQKHSADIIFLEILKVINWFNPFIYLMQRSLKTVHEYIADEQTAAYERDTLAYSSFLLNNAYGIQGAPISHSFFNYNLLKKRIIMLNQKRSGKLARLKYLAAVPLCAGMLCTSTLLFSKDYAVIDLAPQKTVEIPDPVIDSTKYTLKIVNKADKVTVISDKMVFTNPKTNVESVYTVNSLTEKDKITLKEKGFDVSVVAREKKDTIPPPPPPAPPKVKLKSPPPPPAPPKKLKVSHVKFPPPVVTRDKFNGTPPPPPPPYDSAYDQLFTYMAKYTRYPTAAFDKRINGDVILSLVINNEHKITDVKVAKGIGYGCDEEAIRALKAFNGTIDKAPGTYTMVATFMLINEKARQFYAPPALTDHVVDAKNFMGQVTLAGYLK